jgi:hypothetical protein
VMRGYDKPALGELHARGVESSSGRFSKSDS